MSPPPSSSLPDMGFIDASIAPSWKRISSDQHRLNVLAEPWFADVSASAWPFEGAVASGTTAHVASAVCVPVASTFQPSGSSPVGTSSKSSPRGVASSPIAASSCCWIITSPVIEGVSSCSSPSIPAIGSVLRTSPLSESTARSEEHTSELQSHSDLVCRLLLEKKKKQISLSHPTGCVIRRNARIPYLAPVISYARRAQYTIATRSDVMGRPDRWRRGHSTARL